MKLRIIWIFFLIAVSITACVDNASASDENGKSPQNVMLSELHGMNHTIRNFQDLIKRGPSEEAYKEYADFLERRLKIVREEFSEETEKNKTTSLFFNTVEQSLPGLRSKNNTDREAAQKKLNEINEQTAHDLKLN